MIPLRTLGAALALLLVLPTAFPTAAATHCSSLPSNEELECWQGEGGAVGGWVVWFAVGVALMVGGTALGIVLGAGHPAVCMLTEEPPANWAENCQVILPHRA